MAKLLRQIDTSISESRFPVVLAIVVYFVSYGQNLLLGNALFWDDWLNRVSKETAAAKHRLSGFPPTREFLEFDILGNSPVLFRFLAFTSYFVASICLHRILKRGLSLSITQINVITLLFLVAPINSARAALIVMHYSFSFMLFFCAWSLLVARHQVFQLAALPLFWISFGTPSLIPFFLLPFLQWILLNGHQFRKIRYAVTVVLLAVTPLSYWVIRAATFGSDVRDYYLPRPLGVVRGGILILCACVILIYGTFRRQWLVTLNNRPLLAAFGFFAIALGASSYMAGGHLVDISDWLISFVPNFSDWDSRHQLLLGLGIALMVTAAIVDPAKPNLGEHHRRAFVAILGLFCVLNFTYSQEYYLDSLKQDQVITAFREIPELQEASAIMIDDRALRFNARGRSIRSYEWGRMIDIGLKRKTSIVAEPVRFVRCDEFKPSMVIAISAENGRLESLLTGNLGIKLSVTTINPCE